MSVDWVKVCEKIREKSATLEQQLKYGQGRALLAIAQRLQSQPGVILADEVGLGKTRVALIVADAVMECGGNVVAAVPAGLLSQWENEYRDYQLQSAGTNRQVIKLRSFSNLFDQGMLPPRKKNYYPHAKTSENRWAIVSHNFGFHLAGTKSWRIELPALIRAVKEFDTSKLNRWRVYAIKRKYPEAFNNDPSTWEGQYWAASKFLALPKISNRFKEKTREFLARNDIRPDRSAADISKPEIVALFSKKASGYEAMLDLMGHLIGDIDLLIIDEAHKSRDDETSPEKQLSILLEKILRISKGGRRLCLTATPVELGEYQWKSLLDRTKVRVDEQPLNDFASSLAEARKLPNSLEAIGRLIAASHGFKKALSDVVVRRRRIYQSEMQRYCGTEITTAHPHRELLYVRIAFDALSETWKRAVLALEAQGQAAKGLTAGVNGSTLTAKERLTDSRYPFGLGCDVDLEDNCSDKVAPQKSSQYGRYRFWKKTAIMNSGALQGKDRLAEHPRVQSAANHLESKLGLADGDVNNIDKYLIFGRFTLPMQALRDELNIRYLLRCLDLSRPVIAGPALQNNDEYNECIYACYLRIAQLISRDGDGLAFRGELSMQVTNGLLSKEALREMFSYAGKRHDNDIGYVRSVLSDYFLKEKLPGTSAIRLLSEEQQNSLFRKLRAEVFVELYDEFILSEYTEQTKKERIENRALDIWSRYVEDMIEGSEIDGAALGVHSEWNGEAALREIDEKGDRIDPAVLVATFDLEEEHWQQSPFCRILDGSVAHRTRKILQSQFNGMVFPRVLIAQSVVGREGLNLHKKCRRVLLFHPEWNPAVVEQQIGRVDRIESLWTKLADEWVNLGKLDKMPKIIIEQLIFEGTYDEYQCQVLSSRRAGLNAQLFGELLDEATLALIPQEMVDALRVAAPCFEP